MNTLKPQSNRALYSIGTLAIDGWAVTFGTVRRRLGGQLRIIPCGTVIASALQIKA